MATTMNNNTAANQATAAQAESFLNKNLDRLHKAVNAAPGVVKNVIDEMNTIGNGSEALAENTLNKAFDTISSKLRALADEFRKVPSMKRRAEAADRSADTFESLAKEVKELKGVARVKAFIKLILGYIFKVAKTILKGALTVAFWAAVTGVRILCIAGQFIVKLVVTGYKNIVKPGIAQGKKTYGSLKARKFSKRRNVSVSEMLKDEDFSEEEEDFMVVDGDDEE